MMCNGHLVKSSLIQIVGNEATNEVMVRDGEAFINDDGLVEGNVLDIELGEDTTVSFDRDEALAFIEACKEIVDRYPQ